MPTDETTLRAAERAVIEAAKKWREERCKFPESGVAQSIIEAVTRFGDASDKLSDAVDALSRCQCPPNAPGVVAESCPVCKE